MADAYPTGLAGMDANIRSESGTSADAFIARSALRHAHRIVAPTLVLHGDADDRCPPIQARRLADALSRGAVPVTVRIFADTTHTLPRQVIIDEMLPFFDKYLAHDAP